MTISSLHRMVRLTARTSAVLFTSAQVAQAFRVPTPKTWRPLYAAFVGAHAIHFGVVARFALRTQGRSLFPGGRSLRDVGGWPAVLGIYAFFFAVAGMGWSSGRSPDGYRGDRFGGIAAQALIGAMFVSAYLGHVRRSPARSLPAAVIAAAVVINAVRRTVADRTRPG